MPIDYGGPADSAYPCTWRQTDHSRHWPCVLGYARHWPAERGWWDSGGMDRVRVAVYRHRQELWQTHRIDQSFSFRGLCIKLGGSKWNVIKRAGLVVTVVNCSDVVPPPKVLLVHRGNEPIGHAINLRWIINRRIITSVDNLKHDVINSLIAPVLLPLWSFRHWLYCQHRKHYCRRLVEHETSNYCLDLVIWLQKRHLSAHFVYSVHLTFNLG